MKTIMQIIERTKFAAGKYDLELCKKAEAELAALREAGEKMAERLRALKTFQRVSQELDDVLTADRIFVDEDAAALAEWEAANK